MHGSLLIDRSVSSPELKGLFSIFIEPTSGSWRSLRFQGEKTERSKDGVHHGLTVLPNRWIDVNYGIVQHVDGQITIRQLTAR
ncbi:hypothetical protein RvY_01810 [Ramazzottius varieornatus]|uniref:Uncharacterized protein n=1 Tax=Ramazzottius varieornatus TaxID=947166 RepID=A0A1D1UHP1_RAMVA|nr:hypothetical protein RvY_01810 [Ramazzottius varieornatus]